MGDALIRRLRRRWIWELGGKASLKTPTKVCNHPGQMVPHNFPSFTNTPFIGLQLSVTVISTYNQLVQILASDPTRINIKYNSNLIFILAGLLAKIYTSKSIGKPIWIFYVVYLYYPNLVNSYLLDIV